MFKTKKIWIILLVLIIGIIQCKAPKQEEVSQPGDQPLITDGLIAYYPFNGNARDAKAENHGTVSGAVLTKDRSNNSDQAYKFDGADDYIALPININPEKMPELTLVAWANALESSPVRQVISHDDGGFDRSLGIDDRGDGHGWSAFCGNQGVLGGVPITHDKWVFIAVTYSQPDTIVKLYVNDAMFEINGYCDSGHDTTYIGMNPSYGEFFAGYIDEVMIFDRVLSKDEIDRLYKVK